MPDSTQPARQLIALRKRSRLSIKSLAEAAGFAGASSIQRYFKEHYEGYYDLDLARKFADALAGLGSPPITKDEVILAMVDPDQLRILSDPSISPPAVFEDETDRPSLEDMGFVLINAYDVSLSAGHGVINAPQIVPDHKVAFRLDWVRSRTSAAIERLGVLRVSGHSMVPDLHSGDTVLIDMSVTDVRRDGMYAVSYRDGDEAMVKNIQRDPRNGKLIIKSSNVADFPPIPDVEDDRLIIWGRVLWVGRNIE